MISVPNTDSALFHKGTQHICVSVASRLHDGRRAPISLDIKSASRADDPPDALVNSTVSRIIPDAHACEVAAGSEQIDIDHSRGPDAQICSYRLRSASYGHAVLWARS